MRLVLGSSDLREIAYCDQVARTVEFPHLKLLRDRHSHLGVPMISATLSSMEDRHAADVRIRFRPRQTTPGGMKAAEEHVRERCLYGSSHLRSAVEEKAIDLRVIADPEHENLLWK